MTKKKKQDLAGLVSNPKTDFSRNRKIPYEKMLLSFYGSSGIGGIKGGDEMVALVYKGPNGQKRQLNDLLYPML